MTSRIATFNDLNDENLAHFYEGDCQIRNYSYPCIHHGHVGIVCLQGNNILVEFDWFAKGDDFPPVPDYWEKQEISERLFCFNHYVLSNPKDGNLFLKHKVINETVILSPQGVNVVPSVQVKGLKNEIKS